MEVHSSALSYALRYGDPHHNQRGAGGSHVAVTSDALFNPQTPQIAAGDRPGQQSLMFDISGVTASTNATVGRGAMRYPPSPAASSTTTYVDSTAYDPRMGGPLSHLDTSSPTPAPGGRALFPGSTEQFGEHNKGHPYNNADDSSSNRLVSSLPQLMSQTRLVNTRLSQIRNELETVLQSVWAPSDEEPLSSIRSSSLTTSQNSRGGSSVSTATWLTSMAGGSHQHSKSAPLDSDDPLVLLISAPPAANVSLTELHDALGVVEKQIVAVQHTRRIVTRAMERPLAEMKAQHQASPDRSSGSTSAVTAGAALRNRVWIAMEFGEQEVQLLLREIQHLQGHLLAVERRLLALLGVVNHDGHKQVHDSSDGSVATVGSSSFATVYRRREGADVANIRREVEASMRRDPRYALLASTRAALKQPQQRPSASMLDAAAVFRAAGTAAKTLVEDCGWAPDRVQYRSHYLYELERLDELVAHEHEKQQNLSDGKKSTTSSPGRLRIAAHEGDHPLQSTQVVAEGDALVAESTVVDVAADKNDLQAGLDEKPAADDGAMSAQSYPLGLAAVGGGEIAGADSSMAELADALRRLSPLPSSSKHSESAVSASSQNLELAAQAQQKPDENPDPLPNAAEPSSDVPNFAESDDAEMDEGQSHGRPPTPIRFHERVRDYIRSFLRSGACQWVACQDDTTQATFYFNLDSGEREESLEGYFSDSVAESIAQQLLDEGERTGEGWIFVPGGSTEYGEEDYYCHQRSGEVAWSLVDYVKQH
jgi:hypothetical protein